MPNTDLVTMSNPELDRLTVIERVLEGRVSQVDASRQLGHRVGPIPAQGFTHKTNTFTRTSPSFDVRDPSKSVRKPSALVMRWLGSYTTHHRTLQSG